MHKVGYQNYLKTDVITADPKKLVVLCYEEAIRSLNLAKESYLAEEFEIKGKAVEKALNIINELRGVLDFEKGGEVARQLDRIYHFMTLHIMRADQRREIQGFSEVMTMLGELNSAWKEAFYGEREKLFPEISRRASESASLRGNLFIQPMDPLR